MHSGVCDETDEECVDCSLMNSRQPTSAPVAPAVAPPSAPASAPAPEKPITVSRKRSISDCRELRLRVQLCIGERKRRRRHRIAHHAFTPQRAKLWTGSRFSDFLPEIADAPDLALDREAWTQAFDNRKAQPHPDLAEVEAAELACVKTGSPFGKRLAELRAERSSWPFMRSDLRTDAILRLLSDDPEGETADVYWSVSRGVSLMSPAEATAFSPVTVDNYASAAEHSDRVTAEVERLLAAGFIAPWNVIRTELGLDEDAAPAAVLAIGAVDRNGKIRIVIDGSAPRGRSVNDSIDPAATVLPSITLAMLAMSKHGLSWRADLEDAFLQSALAAHSVPLSAIRWQGTLYGYRRLGFGFKSGPTHQQSLSVAVLRAVVRRLRSNGLFAAAVAGCDQKYPDTVPRHNSKTGHAVLGLPAFLDDYAGFCSTSAAAWYSFATFLVTALDINLRVSFKPGKTESPASLMEYLGFMVCSRTMTVFLSEERIVSIREKLAAAAGADTIRLQEMMSLVGTLVFASTVIRVGRTHYRELIDAIVAAGPNAPPSKPLKVSAAVRAAIEMWAKLLGLLNAHSARTVISRQRVPGEVTTDASFAGFGWAGMGAYEYAAWPEDWQQRIGQHAQRQYRRIWICELELWAALFAVRKLAPRCARCRLHLRVDNLPVVGMINKLSTTSARCIPVLRELAWLLAVHDVELVTTHIGTKENLVADVLSRRYAPDNEDSFPRTFLTVLRWLSAKSHDPLWDSWPCQPPTRPELLPHVPIAEMDAYSGELLELDPVEMDRILPAYLRKELSRRGSAPQAEGGTGARGQPPQAKGTEKH